MSSPKRSDILRRQMSVQLNQLSKSLRDLERSHAEQLQEIEEDRNDVAKAERMAAQQVVLGEKQLEIEAEFLEAIAEAEREESKGSDPGGDPGKDPVEPGPDPRPRRADFHDRVNFSAEENKAFRLIPKRAGRAPRQAFSGGNDWDCMLFGQDELSELRDLAFDSRRRAGLIGGNAKIPVTDAFGDPVYVPVGVRAVGAYLHEFDSQRRLKVPRHEVTRALVLEHFEPDTEGVLRPKEGRLAQRKIFQLRYVPSPSRDALISNCSFRPRADGHSDQLPYGTKWHTRLNNSKSFTFKDCDFTECRQEHDIYAASPGDLRVINCTFVDTSGNNVYLVNRPKVYGQYDSPDNAYPSSYQHYLVRGCDMVDAGVGAWSGFAMTAFDLGSPEHKGSFVVEDTTFVSAFGFEVGSGTNDRYPIGSNQTYQPARSKGLFMLHPFQTVAHTMHGECPTDLALIRNSLFDLTQCHSDLGHFRSVDRVCIEDATFIDRDGHSRPQITIDSQNSPRSSMRGNGMPHSGVVTVRGNVVSGTDKFVHIWHPDSSLSKIPLGSEDEIQIDCRTKQVLYQGKRRAGITHMIE